MRGGTGRKNQYWQGFACARLGLLQSCNPFKYNNAWAMHQWALGWRAGEIPYRKGD